MPRPALFLALLLPPIAACAAPMNLTAHITEGDTTFTGRMVIGNNGSGTMVFSAPGGPSCDGVVVPSTKRTPERLEGQIHCSDGRSGAIRMFLSPNLGVGSGRLGRDTITFRAAITRAPTAAPRTPAAKPASPGRASGANSSGGNVTLQELVRDGLARPEGDAK